MRDELRSLPGDLAELVGRHLVAAERALEDDDPDRAHEHTSVARRFAARIGVVREAAGIVAYRAGHYSEALSDLRAARRMTGSDAYLPVMADCERGLGRPERALDLVRSPEAERLDRAERIELAIVESGARRDLNQHDAAVITLQRLPELRDPEQKPWSARLAFAYADALAEAGHQEAATDWFARAMAFDEDGETDAAERYAELTGAVIEDLEEDFDDADTDDADTDDADTDAIDQAIEREEEIEDEAALAEADDLLTEDDEAQDDEPKDEAATDDLKDEEVEDEADEDGTDGDDLDADPGVRADAVTKEKNTAEPSQPGAPDDSAEAEKATAEPTPTGEDASKTQPAEAAPDINLAFIEPNFGDILDEPEEAPTTDRPKRDD
ncbi:hypothetical protein AB0C18_30090 [Nonomuraea muscovyensis]|uniref:hypothetical protein n=1 Tax=Nonomuraea muscovyensis TaxID=1124761 RepID=UPI0033DA9FBA